MTLRPDLARIPAYTPTALDDEWLDLRDNINLWGAPPAAMARLREASATRVRAYPSVGGSALVSALASTLGVHADNIVAGCGSDDVIDACLRVVGSPGARIAYADPSFAMVPTFARLNRLESIGVPLLPSGAANVDALLATRAALIYVCSPNNPTGTITPRDELLRLFDAAPGLVLLDEAYAEYCEVADLRREAAQRENVLITRTFSKAWGLAGLRVGYGVGGATLVRAVATARGPYKVNVLAEQAAVAALTQDAEWMARAAAESRLVRDRFTATLRGRTGVRVFDSHANFAFLGVDAAPLVLARFHAEGIAIRSFANLTGIGDAVRIGVAPWSAFARVVDIAQAVWP